MNTITVHVILSDNDIYTFSTTSRTEAIVQFTNLQSLLNDNLCLGPTVVHFVVIDKNNFDPQLSNEY